MLKCKGKMKNKLKSRPRAISSQLYELSLKEKKTFNSVKNFWLKIILKNIDILPHCTVGGDDGGGGESPSDT